MFVLPEKHPNNECTIKKLICHQIYYIYYSNEQREFLNINNKIINDFCISESDITFPLEDFYLTKAINHINISKNILISSINKFVREKKFNQFKYVNIFENICEKNFIQCIKIFIPTKLKENIINQFISEDLIEDNTHINFLPSTNYNGVKFQEIFTKTDNMIIFSYARNVYLYYSSYFIIKENYTIIKIENLPDIDLESVNNERPKNNLKNFNDIKKYSLFEFCFHVIKNYNFNKKKK